jgi:16S rRNA (adenine1518-N6/adenine1519-N6)-dimethyltransferase
MADELLDLINEKDEVVGKEWKYEMHKNGSLHRTVIGEVIGKGRVWTLVKQSERKQDTNQYVSAVGGHVKSGESNEDALKREAAEEYGLKGKFDYKFIGKKIYSREIKGNFENHLFILYEIYTDQEPVLDDESISLKDFTEKELSEELKTNPDQFGPPFIFLVKNFYSNLL